MKTIEKTELSPDLLVDQIRRRRTEIERILEERVKALKIAPEGKLRFVRKGKAVQYYHKNKLSITEGVYLKRKQDSFAAALAQKDYDSKLISELILEKNALETVLYNYRPERINEIYISLHENRKSLVHPVILPEDDYIERWTRIEYERKQIEENATDYFTAKGERVRSKSEIMIADALSRHKIPYRYEYPTRISGVGTIHPDFTCLNMRTRKEYIWEHFGMISVSDYAENAVNKIKRYMADGYSPGENLILTFESSLHPLSSRIVECNIRAYLL